MREQSSKLILPSSWVVRFLPGAKREGRVLDLACGSGRHIDLCLKGGFPVVGVDRDLGGASRFAREARVELIEADLECGGPPAFA